MSDKEDNLKPIESDRMLPADIVEEMRRSYIDYAMSVITDRALPDVRDGLKPVHRRILYAMHQKGLTSSAKFRKSAVVVGDVLGNFHPHGDISVYDAMVKMAQPFSMRYPLVDGQGNFGSIDGDSAAAMRYTEARMSKMSAEILRDLEKETVEWRPNFDATQQEPIVLPAAVPNILLNGTLGIAVGMATNIPPHNLTEVIAATQHLIDNPEATTEDLLKFVKGPDFPTGGVIFNKQDILQAYSTGRGGMVVRGEAEIIETKSGSYQIVITSIPYRVIRAQLIERIADLVREKKIDGIKGLRDESAKDTRIVIDLKPSSHAQSVLNYLYKHTQLEDTFHLNLVVLVDGVPQTLSLKAVLEEFIKHRQEVVRRRTTYDLRRAKEREHILLGLKKALDHIDEIIATIKKSKDVNEARANLMKKFSFSEIQAQAILEMRLQKLAGLERKKIEDELAEVQALIKELETLLKSAAKMMGVIKEELAASAGKYGDERATRVVAHGAKNFSMEDLVPDEDSMLVVTKGGYIKRTNPNEYRNQKRGGVGVVDLDTKDEDFITNFVTATNHSDILFFTDKGKAYQIKMYELPEGRRNTRGKAIVNFLSLSEGERVTSMLPMPKTVKDMKGVSIMMVTKNGTAKKCAAESFHDVRRSGIKAITLDQADELVSAAFCERGDSCMIVTADGQSIRFDENDVREMGRTAGGVRGISLDKGDWVVSADMIRKGKEKEAKILVFSEKGYGKVTEAEEYKIQKRGGSGIKTANVTDKIGKIMLACVVTDEVDELVAMSKKAQVIRTDLKSIPLLGRSTQGVRVMRLRDGDSIASLVCF
jgi:DNA gyrase subunit A